MTFTAAMSTCVPISNVTWICTLPADDDDELMYSMPGTPLIAFSIGEATVSASVVADAPG